MYYSYVEIEYVATSFSPARTDLALKLLNSVIIFRKHHNILEICFFGTRKHIEVGLNFSLAAGPKRLCLCFYVFLCCPAFLFCWTDLDVRKTDIYFSEVCFLCFLCILGCQKLPISLSVLVIFTIVKTMNLRKPSFLLLFILSPYVSMFVECTINSRNISLS